MINDYFTKKNVMHTCTVQNLQYVSSFNISLKSFKK